MLIFSTSEEYLIIYTLTTTATLVCLCALTTATTGTSTRATAEAAAKPSNQVIWSNPRKQF
jgi:hypothetical protein